MNMKNNSIDVTTLIKKERNYKLILFLFNWLFKRIIQYQVVNLERIPKESGIIYVMNHRDYYDAPLIFSILRKKPVHVLGKKELQNELVGKILGIMGAVFVDRSDADSRKQAKAILIALVSEGSNILITPEGTRNKTDAILLPFSGYGTVGIAQKTGCPIVPFAISPYGVKGKKRIVQVCETFFVNADDDLETANKALYKRLYDAILHNNEMINSQDK